MDDVACEARCPESHADPEQGRRQPASIHAAVGVGAFLDHQQVGERARSTAKPAAHEKSIGKIEGDRAEEDHDVHRSAFGRIAQDRDGGSVEVVDEIQ